MQLIQYPERSEWQPLLQRPVSNTGALEKQVRRILEHVQKKGDKALRDFTEEFDGVRIKELQVSDEELQLAATQLDSNLKAAINQAATNIRRFHEAQQEIFTPIETMPGIRCWRKPVAVEKVGLYIPGGSAPLFSTVLMLGIPATIAGCREIVLCSPPGADGNLHPAILYAAQCCGIRSIFKVGGVQAIAAMAYGTETVPEVDKIFGPGNQYVTLAKQLVQQAGKSIDMPAGPSEVLVIADATANADFIAADLLSQAEHGPDSQVILLVTDEQKAAAVQLALQFQLSVLPRKSIAEKALENSRIIVLRTVDDALAFSNAYAPEHLILACDDAVALAEQVTAAGSVFIGHYSPESVGDYASGTNHTLPTNGYARAYSGVSLDSFIKKITFQQVSAQGLSAIADTVMTMAAAEGLEAHRNAVAIRLKA